MRKLPDLERMISRIYNLTDRQRLLALHYEEFALNRLKDFMAFLPELKKVEEIMKLFEKYVPKFKSARLRKLCTIKDVDIEAFNAKKTSKIKNEDEGLFPRISNLVEDLEKMVTRTEDDVLVPAKGVCAGMDIVLEKLQKVKDKLNKCLEE